MVAEIRIYVEGGGNCDSIQREMRQGFSAFLGDLVRVARESRIKWSIVVCGPRDEAFRAFRTALRGHPDAFNVLLVDAEGPVASAPWDHLRERDGWNPNEKRDENCHLMVQVMESWFAADLDTVEHFYGRGFHRDAIPNTPDVETIDKERVLQALRAATKDTSKGEYRKIRHAVVLLQQLDVAKVRRASRHCDRLFTTLLAKMSPSHT
jgi:hypothetical protein